jgi:SNF2 family DNA or RNA helicase
MQLFLDVDSTENENRLLISPELPTDKLKPRMYIYAKSIGGEKTSKGELVFYLEDRDLTTLYQKIRELFIDRLDDEIALSDSAKILLADAATKAEQFNVFSEKAFSIRNDYVNQSELEQFTNRLASVGFKRTLKPFQLLAAYHLAFSQNACNFSVPGSGKTSTVLAAYWFLKETKKSEKKVDKLLVVGPLSSFLSWKNDFHACFGFTPNTLEIRGGVSSKIVEDELLKRDVSKDLILVSYGSLEGKKEILRRFLRYNNTMVVLDEAHRIKNTEGGVQASAALSLAKFCRSRVILTGTPAPNSYVDLYNLYQFIWPANNIIGYSVTQLSDMSKKPNDPRIADLTKRIEPFFIRVRKKELKLPDPHFHNPTLVEMAPLQKSIYTAIEQVAMKKFEDTSTAPLSAFAARIRLRQAATNPALLSKSLDDYFVSLGDGEDDSVIRTGSTKLDNNLEVNSQISRMIDNYSTLETPPKFARVRDIALNLISQGKRLLVWCEFVGTCEDLSGYMASQGIANEILYGKTDIEERDRIIDEFNAPISSFSVVIANPHAVGESVSLHHECHNALYLEQGFNAGVYMQSKDRIHRVGLPEGVETNYYFLQSKGSVDEVIYRRVLEKETKMIQILESEEIPLLANNIDFFEDSQDDVKAIIRNYYEHRKAQIF